MLVDDIAFHEIVGRELRGNATAEECAYLASDEVIARWRAALVEMVAQAESHGDRMRTHLLSYQQDCMERGQQGKADYFKLKAETEAKLCRTRTFIRLTRKRISEVNQRMKDAEADRRSQSGRKSGYYAGFRDALLVLHDLAADGRDMVEVWTAVNTHLLETVKPWRDGDVSGKTFPPRPTLPVERQRMSA